VGKTVEHYGNALSKGVQKGYGVLKNQGLGTAVVKGSNKIGGKAKSLYGNVKAAYKSPLQSTSSTSVPLSLKPAALS
jgi:hypothetical protein